MRLALLALQSLEQDETRELQRHLGTCEGCRTYFDELRTVSRNIAEVEPLTGLPRSADFHEKLLNRLEAETPRSLLAKITNLCHSLALPGRAALPVLGASAAAIAVLLFLHRGPTKNQNRPVDPGLRPVAAATSPKTDLSPTLSTYQFLANHSPEKLDEFLTRQASRNPAPAPVYTAATLSSSELIE